MNELFRFLGVSTLETIETGHYNKGGLPRFGKLNYWLNQSGIVSWAKRTLPKSWRQPFKRWMYADEIPPMSDEQRQWLIDYYRDDILQLQNLIHRDLSNWLK
jgi:hypothetical protein